MREEVLKLAKEMMEKDPSLTEWISTKFPELKGNENERIRKNCIHFLELQKQHHAATFEIEECISWLEKQGEKDPADKIIRSKFRKGEWIVDNIDTVYQIKEIKEDKYLLQFYNSHDVISSKISTVDNDCHLWTIQDTKNGDVLATLDYILIFEKLLHKDGGVSYCHYDFSCSKPQFIFNKDDNWYFGKEAKVYPATKEQRDFLFQKMKEAGYEWDADKKELKKIEGEPEKLQATSNV